LVISTCSTLAAVFGDSVPVPGSGSSTPRGFRSRRIRRRKVYGCLNPPFAVLLHEPVDETAAILDNLFLDADACVLHAGDDRAGRCYVDLNSVEPHGENLARNLLDALEKRFDADCGSPMRSMDEPRCEQPAQGGRIPPPDGVSDLLRRFNDLVTVRQNSPRAEILRRRRQACRR
jgi:hypothetical protein